MQSHYDILEVKSTATAEDIKKAYRKILVEGAHPDKGGDTEKCIRIMLAYEILSSPDKRSQYDKSLAGDHPPTPDSQYHNAYQYNSYEQLLSDISKLISFYKSKMKTEDVETLYREFRFLDSFRRGLNQIHHQSAHSENKTNIVPNKKIAAELEQLVVTYLNHILKCNKKKINSIQQGIISKIKTEFSQTEWVKINVLADNEYYGDSPFRIRRPKLSEGVVVVYGKQELGKKEDGGEVQIFDPFDLRLTIIVPIDKINERNLREKINGIVEAFFGEDNVSLKNGEDPSTSYSTNIHFRLIYQVNPRYFQPQQDSSVLANFRKRKPAKKQEDPSQQALLIETTEESKEAQQLSQEERRFYSNYINREILNILNKEEARLDKRYGTLEKLGLLSESDRKKAFECGGGVRRLDGIVNAKMDISILINKINGEEPIDRAAICLELKRAIDTHLNDVNKYQGSEGRAHTRFLKRLNYLLMLPFFIPATIKKVGELLTGSKHSTFLCAPKGATHAAKKEIANKINKLPEFKPGKR